MADLSKLEENPEAALWEAIDDVTAVMLGVEGLKHMQPMSPQVAADEKTIYFYTEKSSEIAQKAGAGADGMLCHVNLSDEFYSCLTGTLAVHHSMETIARFWNLIVAAWFEQGKDDPDLTMLSFKPREAAIWGSTDSTLAFGWAIAKANLTEERPDIGVTKTITIAGGTM